MKMKTPLRILSVAFALSMLTAYVVYSQKQQSRHVAPSSKVMVIDAGREQQIRPTNNPAPKSEFFAPGSKSLAPVMRVPPAGASEVPTTTKIAPGSKSAAPVFDFTPSPNQESVKTNPSTARPLTTNQVKP